MSKRTVEKSGNQGEGTQGSAALQRRVLERVDLEFRSTHVYDHVRHVSDQLEVRNM